MIIRTESAEDHTAVGAITRAAFETSEEARLVESLREQAHPFISLVAEKDGNVVGHILFSPVTLEGQSSQLIMGLAPMAVAPGYQRTGIGSALVMEGLTRCREIGACAVVVLGHADYYPKFGFKPSTQFEITSEYEVPEEVFMVLELEPGVLKEKEGVIRYHPAFEGL